MTLNISDYVLTILIIIIIINHQPSFHSSAVAKMVE